MSFFGFAFVNGQSQRANSAAKAASVIATVGKNIFLAEMANNLMALIAGDALSSAVPEHDSAVLIEQVHAKLQAVENGAKYIWVVGEHVQPLGARPTLHIGRKIGDLKYAGNFGAKGVEQERHSAANHGSRNALPAWDRRPPKPL